jgi:hypothetical protein
MTDTPKAEHEAEFDVFLARAGMVIPADRRKVVIEGWADFRAQLDLLHTRRDAAAEPSNIFRMKGVAR